MSRNALIAAAATALSLAVAAAPASAKPVVYQGDTGSGPISFKRTGNAVTELSAYLPTACASSRTSDTMAGADSLTPDGAIALGSEHAATEEDPTAMGMSSSAEKNYRVTLTPKPGGAIVAKLHMNFMVFEPYYNAWGHLDANTFVCQGDATVKVKPVRPGKRRARG